MLQLAQFTGVTDWEQHDLRNTHQAQCHKTHDGPKLLNNLKGLGALSRCNPLVEASSTDFGTM